MGGFADLSSAYVARTQKERGRTDMGALNTTHRTEPGVLGRNPPSPPSTYPR